MNPQFNVAERSAKLIYKDLIKMVLKTYPKYKQKSVLAMLRREFDKNKSVANPKEIETLKLNAGKAIADTFIYHVKQEHLDKKREQEKSKLNNDTLHNNKL